MAKIVQFPVSSDDKPEHEYVDLTALTDEEVEAFFALLPQATYEAEVIQVPEQGGMAHSKIVFFYDEENRLGINIGGTAYFILDEARLLKWLSAGRV